MWCMWAWGVGGRVCGSSQRRRGGLGCTSSESFTLMRGVCGRSRVVESGDLRLCVWNAKMREREGGREGGREEFANLLYFWNSQ